MHISKVYINFNKVETVELLSNSVVITTSNNSIELDFNGDIKNIIEIESLLLRNDIVINFNEAIAIFPDSIEIYDNLSGAEAGRYLSLLFKKYDIEIEEYPMLIKIRDIYKNS